MYTVLRLVTQCCLTLCNPMDYSQPSSSVHGTPQARIEYWSVQPFSTPGELPKPRTEPWLLHCRRIPYRLSHKGSTICEISPKI